MTEARKYDKQTRFASAGKQALKICFWTAHKTCSAHLIKERTDTALLVTVYTADGLAYTNLSFPPVTSRPDVFFTKL